MSDIRKWFMKQHEKGAGSDNASKPAKSLTPEKPPGADPQPEKVAQGEDFLGRRKTSKYFAKDKQNVEDETGVKEVSTKRKGRGDGGVLSKELKPPPEKKIHKIEIDDDDEDGDFISSSSRKSTMGTTPGKRRIASVTKSSRKFTAESDDDDYAKIKSNSNAAGKGRGAKDSSATPINAKSMDVAGSEEEDVDDKDVKSVKSGGRGRGGRGVPASARGRGGGGRGGFMNFGERKDPPHKGEKEVPTGAANCFDGLTFVISGTLDSLEREEAEDLIKRHGGRVTGSVSKKTNYLLCDEDIGGRKSEKAKELGTVFLTEDGLFDMIRASNNSATAQATKKTADKVVPSPTKKTADKVVPSPTKKSLQKPEQLKQVGHIVASKDTKGLTPSAVYSKLPSTQNLLPWTEKYKPKVPNDIVGNQSLVKQLHDWLANWNQQFLNAGQKGKGKKPNDSGAKKCVLLSGTPGIGKTTSAKLVSQMLGFRAIEVNASDSRGKADAKIQKGIGGSTSNSIKELVSNEGLNPNMERSQNPNTVLIMDEVDGMSAGDRGGIADLIASIKISKIPIICICNDRYSQKLKSLVNYCLLLSYRKPTKQQMAKRLSQIANAEHLQVNEIALEELAERVNGDMRMALNQLQYMSLSLAVLNFDDIKQRLQNSSKDEDISPFTAVDKLFGFNGGKLRMDERIDLSMSDPDLVPLLVQENYINYRPSSSGKDDNQLKRMSLLARAAESIADGDIVNVQIRRYRQWQLSQIGSLASCIIPAALLHGQREILEQGERNFNRFGGWLGKNSTARKNYRLLEDLHVHLLSSRESNLGRATLRLDYHTLLLKQLTHPLRVLPKDEAVEKVVDFMDLYSINMEDLDTIVELSKFKGHPNPLDGIQPAVKAALTRAYNKGGSSRVIKTADFITLPGMKKAPKKRVAAMLEPVDDALVEENAIDSAENEEEILSDTGDQDDSSDDEKMVESDLRSLNSKAIKVEMELKGSGNSSAKKAPAGRGRGKGSAGVAAATSDQKGGRGTRSGSKRKR